MFLQFIVFFYLRIGKEKKRIKKKIKRFFNISFLNIVFYAKIVSKRKEN